MPISSPRRLNIALVLVCLLAWTAMAGVALRAQTTDDNGGVRVGALDANVSVVRNVIDPQVVLADGKLLAAAWVTGNDGVSQLTLLRFDPDGSVDPGFDASALALRWVSMLKLQPDGKLLAAGQFGPDPNAGLVFDDGSNDPLNDLTVIVTQPDPVKLVRLNADGSIDVSFAAVEYAFDQPGLLQPLADGKTLVGRTLTDDNGVSQYELRRLNADGSADLGFNASLPVGASLDDLQVQPDGKLLVSLNTYGVETEENTSQLIRLNADGSTDAGFQPVTQSPGLIDSFALLPDGKVFAVLLPDSADDEVSPSYFARFNADGSPDAGFAQGSKADGAVIAIYSQPGGKTLLAGYFTTINGVARQNVARLNADGSLDESFDPLGGIDGLFFASLVHWADGGFAIGYNLDGNRPSVVLRFNAASSLLSSRNLDSGDSISQLLARPDGGVYADVYTIETLEDVVTLENDFPGGFAPPPGGGVSVVVRDNLPVVSLKAIRSEAYSGSAAKGKFLLTRTGDLSRDLYVDYTVQGSAVGGQDYQTLKGRRIIKAGKASAKIKIKPVGERYGQVAAGKATIKLTLMPGSDYSVTAPTSARVKILSTPATPSQ
jgi:uncharacterized delta-60 repeat protein